MEELVNVDTEAFEQLPPLTAEESLSVLVSERPLAVAFWATDKGKEMLRRAYFSCAYTHAELADIFNSTKEEIQTFVSAQGWPAERDKSRREGEIAQKRQALRLRAEQIKAQALEVAAKGIHELSTYEGDMVVAASKNFRSLVQSIADLAPEDEKKGPTHNSIINIGSQVLITDE